MFLVDRHEQANVGMAHVTWTIVVVDMAMGKLQGYISIFSIQTF